ncbi:hypothetical protein pb186bvf_003107 [Paramecium bursaria]
MCEISDDNCYAYNILIQSIAHINLFSFQVFLTCLYYLFKSYQGYPETNKEGCTDFIKKSKSVYKVDKSYGMIKNFTFYYLRLTHLYVCLNIHTYLIRYQGQYFFKFDYQALLDYRLIQSSQIGNIVQLVVQVQQVQKTFEISNHKVWFSYSIKLKQIAKKNIDQNKMTYLYNLVIFLCEKCQLQTYHTMINHLQFHNLLSSKCYQNKYSVRQLVLTQYKLYNKQFLNFTNLFVQHQFYLIMSIKNAYQCESFNYILVLPKWNQQLTINLVLILSKLDASIINSIQTGVRKVQLRICEIGKSCEHKNKKK